MTQALIDAAANNDLAQVKILLNQTSVDINFLGTCTVNGLTRRNHTALTAAVANKAYDTALYLIHYGAALVATNYTFSEYPYYGKDGFDDDQYPSVLALSSAFEVETWFFKELLLKSKTINPVFTADRRPNSATRSFLGHTLVEHINNYSNLNNKKALLKLILHEAILRNEQNTLTNVRAYISDNYDLTSMSEYLKDRPITTKEFFNAECSINDMVRRNYMEYSAAVKLKQFLESQIILQIEDLPDEVIVYLRKTPNRSHIELFAELQYWLYPEENLPPVPVDHISSKLSATKKSVAEIKEWQDLNLLRDLLELEPKNVMKLLLKAGPLSFQNPAVILLATILFHKSNETIERNSIQQPLLTDKQKWNGLQVLYQIHNLNPYIQDLQQDLYNQTMLTRSIEKSNLLLHDKIKSLEQNLQLLTTNVNFILSKENNSTKVLNQKNSANIRSMFKHY